MPVLPATSAMDISEADKSNAFKTFKPFAKVRDMSGFVLNGYSFAGGWELTVQFVLEYQFVL